MMARVLCALCMVGAFACADAGPEAGPVHVEQAVLLAAGDAHRPTVAVDSARNRSYVAWVGGDSTQNVYIAASTDFVFAAPVRVNDIPGDAAAHEQAPAQVAVGPEGNVYVAWQNNTVVPGRQFPASELRFARSVDGGRTFAPAIDVSDDAGGEPTSHTFHNIAVAADGAIFVSWIDGRAGTSDIRIARSDDGGQTFGASVVVAREACPCCRTALALGGGVVYLAWRDVATGSIRDIVVARSFDDGLTWSSPVRVHQDDWRIDGCPHAGPALAVTADGRLHVVWYTGAEERQGLHYASADSALAFGASQPLLTGPRVTPSIAALAARDSGVIAVWEERVSDGSRVHIADAASRSATQTLAGRAPAIAARSDGAVVVFLRQDSLFAMITPDAR